MADPKYADLPGIAYDEPDVYETSELPESEQAADFYEEENDPIEKIHITSDDAFNKFKGKYVDGTKVDFSSKIEKRIRTGYTAGSGDWEVVGRGQETPIQKYNRLQCEMKELLEEISEIQKNKSSEDLSCLVSTEKVEQSLKKLADLKLEQSLGEEVVKKLSDPQGIQIKKLISQIEEYKATIHEKPESQVDTDLENIVYQFAYKPGQASLAQTSRIAELETRLNRLENVLGASNDKLTRLTVANSKGNLLETAEHLSATASLLDSAQLDHIEGRLGALAQKLEGIAEKKKQMQQDEEKDKIILELFEMVKNTEHVSKLLPKTIARLKALEELHKKATDFTKTLAQIEAAQTEIIGNIDNNKTLLQGVQESFAMSLNEINSTVISLDSRIKALKKTGK